MTAEQWRTGRWDAALTQVDVARSLKISQPYLSQLESGLRVSSSSLARKAAKLFGLPTAFPLREPRETQADSADDLQRKIASLGYPGFEHVRSKVTANPAEVIFSALSKADLDTRIVESLPWVLATYTGLRWEWLRDNTKLHNAQNRLGYVVHLASETARVLPGSDKTVALLSGWKSELEEARLGREGTLCRDSMPEPERAWLRTNRPAEAAHWGLLTNLTINQLSYAAA